MKEFTAISHNVIGAACEGSTFNVRAEIVIASTEPEIEVDASGGAIRRRVVTQHRFLASVSGLRMIADHLTELADTIEKDWQPRQPKPKGVKK